MLTKSNRTHRRKQQNYFDFTSDSKKQLKFYEPKRVLQTYYGIGMDRETGKEFILDYQAKYRGIAEAYFDVEFNAMNADLIYVGVYK